MTPRSGQVPTTTDDVLGAQLVDRVGQLPHRLGRRHPVPDVVRPDDDDRPGRRSSSSAASRCRARSAAPVPTTAWVAAAPAGRAPRPVSAASMTPGSVSVVGGAEAGAGGVAQHGQPQRDRLRGCGGRAPVPAVRQVDPVAARRRHLGQPDPVAARLCLVLQTVPAPPSRCRRPRRSRRPRSSPSGRAATRVSRPARISTGADGPAETVVCDHRASSPSTAGAPRATSCASDPRDDSGSWVRDLPVLVSMDAGCERADTAVRTRRHHRAPACRPAADG